MKGVILLLIALMTFRPRGFAIRALDKAVIIK